MSEYRQGRRKAKHTSTYINTKVEIGVEIGLIINSEIKQSKDIIDENYIISQIKDYVIDLFNIDNKNRILNSIKIYNIQ